MKRAVEFFAAPGEALDIGAGSLRNAKYLLENGFKVTAVDKDPITRSEGEELHDKNLTVISSSYAEFDFPTSFYNLVIGINSLPFEVPSAYPALFEKVLNSIKPNGILAMTFFGPKDDWTRTNPSMSFHSRADIQNLSKDLQIQVLEEVEEDATTIQGLPKHWHLFRMIAKKL